jgi:hypothetical protein
MSNSKHTPGPWKQGSTHPENVSAGSALVCTTLSRGRFNDEQKANARLIAAAPDLLEALQTMLKHPDTMTAKLVAQAAIARAAGLNKATGETK